MKRLNSKAGIQSLQVSRHFQFTRLAESLLSKAYASLVPPVKGPVRKRMVESREQIVR